jgi:LmbE family N-acetylglucosaminyl deacetylase
MNTMGSGRGRWLVCALVALGIGPLRAEEEFLIGTPAIRYSLAKLNVLGSVLMIGAHPDDENNALLAYLSRGLKLRTGYLACTRGEGGQNLLGQEQGALLGVLRTQELLAARRDDGGSQYFTRAIDFGFTTSPEETMANWGREKTLADIVWIIRQQQPDVIILSFSGTASDGHGHHQASAILGREAYEAAADPRQFPEQLKWVKPWKARRLMRVRFTPLPTPGAKPDTEQAPGPGRGGPPVPAGPAAPATSAVTGRGPGRGPDPFPNQPVITLETGDYDAVMGRSYREIGVISRNEHRSQGQGAPLLYGEGQGLLAYVAGEQPAKGVFDGIDTSWARVPGGARIGELLARAQREFDDQHPEKTVPVLLEARRILAPLAQSAGSWGRWKLEEIDEAIALSAGVRAEAESDAPAFVPGGSAKVTLTALNRSILPVALTGVHVSGWSEADAVVKNKTLAFNKPEVATMTLAISKSQAYSQPYWLREPHEPGSYNIPDQTMIGRAENEPEVMATFDFVLNSGTFSLMRPLHYRAADPSKGQYIWPVVVQPPFSIDLPAANVVYPSGGPHDIALQIRALTPNQSGEVRLELPQGWKASPASVPFSMKEAGLAQEARFRLWPPAGNSTSTGRFKVVAKSTEGVEIATGVDVIPYSHIPQQTVLTPADGKISAAPLKVLARRVGYVMGSSDRVPEALRQMGCQVDLLGEKDLSSGNLAVYDAIVTGVRAYSVRPDLRAAQQRLLEYTRNGGTLVVQYNNGADARISPAVADALDHLGPYPFTFGRDDARVTDENSAVKVLLPASPILNVPNKITQSDFEGWVQERGLYFSNKWDAKYETPIETHDAGKAELPGGMLYTRYGKGVYIFTAYSWFRELPAGVPGAYRIFANLISAGKATVSK